MKNMSYANMAKDLLGEEMYCTFIKEISKENRGEDLIDYGNEILNKCCCLIVMFGMSNKTKLDDVKICLSNKVITIPCKEFALKFEKYINQIEKGIDQTILNC